MLGDDRKEKDDEEYDDEEGEYEEEEEEGEYDEDWGDDRKAKDGAAPAAPLLLLQYTWIPRLTFLLTNQSRWFL